MSKFLPTSCNRNWVLYENRCVVYNVEKVVYVIILFLAQYECQGHPNKVHVARINTAGLTPKIAFHWFIIYLIGNIQAGMKGDILII